MSALENLFQQAMFRLMLSEADLSNLVRTAPRRYKVYPILKRKPGQFRIIAQPAREIKDLQYFLMEVLLDRLPIHEAAAAYRSGQSIFRNAEQHVSNSVILKMDFRNFFGSILAEDWRAYAHKGKLFATEEDLRISQQILFWLPRGENQLRLSIGAPSSPSLSNIIMFEFDALIHEACLSKGVVYTRYADDLTFSSNFIEPLREIKFLVSNTLRNIPYPRLEINSDKTVLVTKKYRRTVTGLVLANDGKVSLGRDRKRRIRASVHHFNRGLLSDDEILSLKGLVAFALDVDPAFYKSLVNSYGSPSLERLAKFQKKNPQQNQAM